MAWILPRTWVTGEVVTAALGNTHWRDNLRYLKGLDGAVTIDADLTVPNLITAGTVDGVDVGDHVANTTTVHGAVSAATASKFVVRDASARAKFGAPNASGDALIKGTRVTTTELPAMPDEKYWVGTGANVEERAVPVIPTIVRKTADEVVNNSDSLQNDDHLVFAVGANEVWEIIVVLRAKRAGSQNIKSAWVLPAGASGERIMAYGSTTWITPEDITGSRNTTGMNAATRHIQYRWIYFGGGNAGNVQFQWAQTTAEANNTTIEENSFLIAHRLV